MSTEIQNCLSEGPKLSSLSELKELKEYVKVLSAEIAILKQTFSESLELIRLIEASQNETKS